MQLPKESSTSSPEKRESDGIDDMFTADGTVDTDNMMLPAPGTPPHITITLANELTRISHLTANEEK